MASTISTYRQLASEGRMQLMRNAPIPMKFLTQLVAVEKLLDALPGLPVRVLAGNEFSSIEPGVANALEQVHQCHEVVVHLRYLTDQGLVGEWDKVLIQQATDLYAREAQRLLGGVIKSDSPFWEQYHTRQGIVQLSAPLSTRTDVESVVQLVQHRYGLFFAALDAVHHCTLQRNSLAYQLLLNSLKWALTGYYLPLPFENHQRTEAFHNALRLVDSLDVPGYEDWLIAYKNACHLHRPPTTSFK